MAKILIVEDDGDTSAAVARLLEGRGYQTRVESNGAAALLAAHEDLPDVILMDLMMPILEGQETITALRHDQRTAHIPVVVLAGHPDDRALAGALVAGANVHLEKPPESAELLAVVDRLLSVRPREEGQR